jgi:hypothetical protein
MQDKSMQFITLLIEFQINTLILILTYINSTRISYYIPEKKDLGACFRKSSFRMPSFRMKIFRKSIF